MRLPCAKTFTHEITALMKPTRRHDLDFLRVIAILLLMFFHTGMIFVANWGWHIKDGTTSYLFQEWMFFLNRWRMVLLFFISGAGTWYALGMRTGKSYVSERIRRLLLPLVFGMLVIVPPQIYMEHLWRGADYAHYFAFYPSVFEGIPYPEGSVSWHHLWFVAYLFLYSLIALPFFLFLRSASGKRLTSKLAEKSGAISLYLPVIVIATGYMTLAFIQPPGERNLVDDGARFFYYFCFFVLGYLAQTHPRFWELIESRRRQSLKLAFLCLIIVNYIRWNGLEPAWGTGWQNLSYTFVGGLHAYAWVMAILGYGKKYLNRPSKTLTYANEGIYPFYILHQTVIVIIGYYVIQDFILDSIWAKFWFINLATFVICIGLYELFIRPNKFIRPFFGLKPIKQSPTASMVLGEYGKGEKRNVARAII